MRIAIFHLLLVTAIFIDGAEPAAVNTSGDYLPYQIYMDAPVDGEIIPVGVNNSNSCLPGNFSLLLHYADTFDFGTAFSSNLVESVEAKITIYDLPGREVLILIEDFRQAGVHTVIFNAANQSRGAYFCRLPEGNAGGTKSMELLK